LKVRSHHASVSMTQDSFPMESCRPSQYEVQEDSHSHFS